MAEKQAQSTTGSEVIEFYNELENLHKISVDYRTALRFGNAQGIGTTTESLMEAVQKLHYATERYARPKIDLANEAMAIVGAFNAYVPLYNAFAEASDRSGVAAQDSAQKAEAAFEQFVNRIVENMEALKPQVKAAQEADAKGNGIGLQQITVNPNISVVNTNTNETNVHVNIAMAILTAKQSAQDQLTDEKERAEVLGQLNDLESMAKDRTNEKGFWKKLQEKLKWLAGKSLQVASILLPAIASFFK